MGEEEMSKEIRAKDYIEKIGKRQWKYVMRLTLLGCDESGQFVVLGGDLIPDGGDFSSEGNLHRFRRRRSSLSFKSYDRVIQFSDLFQDFFPRSHCFTISPICESSKARDVKSGFPTAMGMFKKQYFIPLSQAKWIQTPKSMKKMTL